MGQWGLYQYLSLTLNYMEMRSIQEVPIMKISCVVLPSDTSCLDM